VTAEALGLGPGEPLLEIQRVFCASDGRAIQVGRTCYRVDHYRYNFNLRPIEERRETESGARRRLL